MKKRSEEEERYYIIWIIRITFIFIVCSLFIDYSRKVNTFEKKEEKEESESECVCIWVNESEVWERGSWCKKHNIRTERCDCEHRAVLAGQQSSLLPKLTVIHLTNSLQKNSDNLCCCVVVWKRENEMALLIFGKSSCLDCFRNSWLLSALNFLHDPVEFSDVSVWSVLVVASVLWIYCCSVWSVLE